MKAIIPAAGLGTRLLPVTKVVPKELLPVAGKPAIQWALEEATQAGFRELIVVINPHKAILRDYLIPLDHDPPLASYPALDPLERLLRSVNITFVEQPAPLGLGDALLRCRDLIGDEPFALLLPDNIFAAGSRLLKRLMEVHTSYAKSCVALWHASGPHLRDGAVIAESYREPVCVVREVLPKGAVSYEATDLRAIGRSVLQPAALEHLARHQTGGKLDDVPLFNGLAREKSLLGLLIAEEFIHLGVGKFHSEGSVHKEPSLII